jgi:hypothetical protein
MRHHDPGDLYIKFNVEFPQQLLPMTAAQRDALKGILGLEIPPRVTNGRAQKPYDQGNLMELDDDLEGEVDPLQVPLPPGVHGFDEELVDVERPGAGRRGITIEDEDEDAEPGRPQCTSQ